MSMPIHLLDTVAVVRDLPEFGLTAGEIGAIVEILSETAYEVEFCDHVGQTYGLHTLRTDQIIPLHVRGSALRIRGGAA